MLTAAEGGAMIDTDGRPAGLRWEYDRQEVIADGVVHGLGIGFGVVGAVFLIVAAAGLHGPVELSAVVIYALGLLAMFCCSAAYNLWPISRTKWLLRRFDHAAIYLLIAGTYTPLMTGIPHGGWSLALFVGVWAAALTGIVIKIAWPGRLDRVSIGLYLAISWSAVLAYEEVIRALPASTLGLVAAGGLLYTSGVIFHLWHGLRFQNAIWHAFVLAAAICHYGAVLDLMVLRQGA
jgi:hemolysin III